MDDRTEQDSADNQRCALQEGPDSHADVLESLDSVSENYNQ